MKVLLNLSAEILRNMFVNLICKNCFEINNTYKTLRTKTLTLLINYENLYMDPVPYIKGNKEVEDAIKQFREVASEFGALSDRMPDFCLGVPPRDVLHNISKHLFGLSNDMYLYRSNKDISIEHNERRKNEIYNMLDLKNK